MSDDNFSILLNEIKTGEFPAESAQDPARLSNTPRTTVIPPHRSVYCGIVQVTAVMVDRMRTELIARIASDRLFQKHCDRGGSGCV